MLLSGQLFGGLPDQIIGAQGVREDTLPQLLVAAQIRDQISDGCLVLLQNKHPCPDGMLGDLAGFELTQVWQQ